MQATRPILRRAMHPITRVYPLPVPDSCIFHMDMAQADPQITDHSRMRRHGTNSGSTRVGGPRGTIRDFDGPDFDTTSDYVSIGDKVITGGARSIEAWLYPDGWGGSNFGTICSNGFTRLHIDNTNATLYFTSDAQVTVIYSASNSIGLNSWRHVVVAETSGAVANFYVNGVASGSLDQSAGSIADSGTAFWVGARNVVGNRANGFDGRIGLIRLYDRVLTLAEVKQLFRESAWRFKVAA